MEKQKDPPSKGNVPSYSDSLSIWKNAVDVDNFYRNSGKYKIDLEERIRPESIFNTTWNSLNEKGYNNFISELSTSTHKPGFDSRISKPKEMFRVGASSYRQNIDQNKYRQREIANSVLNMEAPMQLFDKRISPTNLTNYSEISKEFGDLVTVFRYDPLAVKPWRDLSARERSERIKKFGTTGTPVSDVGNFKKENIERMSPRMTIPELNKSGILSMNSTNLQDRPRIYKFAGGFVDPRVASSKTIRSESNRQLADDELLTKEQLKQRQNVNP